LWLIWKRRIIIIHESINPNIKLRRVITVYQKSVGIACKV
jgi:hypothetical protein